MSDIREVELHVAMDENGDIGIGESAEDAVDHYAGNYTLTGPLRVAKVTVRMSRPVVVEAEAVAIADEDTTIQIVKGGA